MNQLLVKPVQIGLVEAGVDETVGEAPVDRYAAPKAAAKANNARALGSGTTTLIAVEVAP